MVWQKIVSVEDRVEWYLAYSSFCLDSTCKSYLHSLFKSILEKSAYVSFLLNFSVSEKGMFSVMGEGSKIERLEMVSLMISPAQPSSCDRAKTRYCYEEGYSSEFSYRDDTEDEEGRPVFRMAQGVGPSQMRCFCMNSLEAGAARAFIKVQILNVLSNLKAAYEAEKLIQNRDYCLIMLNRLEGLQHEVLAM